jgi:hypothetical protein
MLILFCFVLVYLPYLVCFCLFVSGYKGYKGCEDRCGIVFGSSSIQTVQSSFFENISSSVI